MKVRLAKKIIKHNCSYFNLKEKYKKKGYNVKWLLAFANYNERRNYQTGVPIDYRIFKAISLTKKRNNHVEKVRYCGNCCWFENEDAYGMGWCSINDCETSCGQACILTLNK